MFQVKGDLDLYIYDIRGKLVKHHTQSNYDTLQARITPSFSSNVFRITQFDYTESFHYPKKLVYGEYADLPLIIPNDAFVPSSITLDGEGKTVLSYDMGTTWYTYDGTQLVAVTINNVDDLRSVGMTNALLDSIPEDTHFQKYQGHLLVRTTPDVPGHAINYIYTVHAFDHRLLDPYYARWFGLAFGSAYPYILKSVPISTSMSDNVYTINVSNLGGANPINIDTIYTLVDGDEYIGTLTYVGVTVEPDHVLTGTYTITVESGDEDISAQRTKNLFMANWTSETPSNTDGILGGMYYGGGALCHLKTYEGGPVQNAQLLPFTPDAELRRESLSRQTIRPYSFDSIYDAPYIDAGYVVQSTGTINLYTSDESYLSKLTSLPSILKFRILSSGDSGVATYQVWYNSKIYQAMPYARQKWLWSYRSPNYPYVESGDQETWYDHYNAVAYHYTLLKSADEPLPWGYILYGKLGTDDDYIPNFSCNPFFDIIVETYKTRIIVKRYGSDEILFRLDSNSGEEFHCATATYEDPTGRDLHIITYIPDTQVYKLSSIPVSITRSSDKLFKFTVNGDLSERHCVGNIHDPFGTVDGLYLHTLLKIQNAQNGPWDTQTLLGLLKTMSNDDYLAVCHEDATGAVDDASKVIDHVWNYRHLTKYGNVTSASDDTGDQIIEFDGTSLAYLEDTLGGSGLDSRLDMQNPILSTYIEYRPSTTQDSTVLSCRGGKLNLKATGELEFSPEAPAIVPSGTPSIKLWTYVDVPNGSAAQYGFGVMDGFIDPSTDKPMAIITWWNGASYNPHHTIFLDLTTGSWTDIENMGHNATVNNKYFSWIGRPYIDPSDGHTKFVGLRTDTDDPALQIIVYDVVDDTLDFWDGINPDGLTGNIGARSHYSFDVNSIDATLYIFPQDYASNVDRCVIEVDLVNKTATYGTGSWTMLSGGWPTNNGGRVGVSYTDESTGDKISLLIMTSADTDWANGGVWFFNHTTRTSEKINIGKLFDDYGFTNNINGSHRLTKINNKYAFLNKTNYDSNIYVNYHPHQYSIIDLQNKSVFACDIYGLTGSGVRSGGSYMRPGGLTTYPEGYEDKALSECLIVDAVSINSLWDHGYVYTVPFDLSWVNGTETTGTPTYSTTTDNTTAIVDMPGRFSLVVHGDGNHEISGTNAVDAGGRLYTNLQHLNTLTVGGTLSYTGTDQSSISSYTAASLYNGAVKNLVIKKNALDQGPYRFQPCMYDLSSIISLSANFTGTTTLLFQISDLADLSLDGVYFLDTNNSMTITKVVDSNLDTVTPNTIDDLNAYIDTIQAHFSTDTRIGFFYYDIDGNQLMPIRSEVYVEFDAELSSGVVIDPAPIRMRRAADYMSAHNGHYMMSLHHTINNQVDRPVADVADIKVNPNYDYVSAASTIRQYTLQHDGLIINALYKGQNRDYSYSNYGVYTSFGCALITLDKLDHYTYYSMASDNTHYAAYTTDYTAHPRVYLAHDPFDDFYALGWGTDEHDTIVFHRPSESMAQYSLVPTRNYTFDLTNEQAIMVPLCIDDGIVNTTHPFPLDAPTEFTLTSSSTVSTTWGGLYWYFNDGTTGTSFVQDEVLTFGVANNFGFAIDNWQVINSFGAARMSGINTNFKYNMCGHMTDGEMIELGYVPGVVDQNSVSIEEPSVDDKFFVIFGTK